MARPLHSLSWSLALAAFALHVPAVSASCVRAGNPEAQEVEIVECIDPWAYFEAHFLTLHPPSWEPGAIPSDRPRRIFNHQLATQPGAVLRVRMLRRREYSERRPPEGGLLYRWEGRWRRLVPAEDAVLYLRRSIAGCGSIEVGTKAAFIWAPQCCDTGYYGEIGCHLDLAMVQYLPNELKSGPPGR